MQKKTFYILTLCACLFPPSISMAKGISPSFLCIKPGCMPGQTLVTTPTVASSSGFGCPKYACKTESLF